MTGVSYSSDPNKHAGPNKRAGWNLDKNSISVQLVLNKRAGWNFASMISQFSAFSGLL